MAGTDSTPDLQTQPVRMAEVLSAFSLATDLGAGQPMGDAIRTCYVAMSIAKELRLSAPEQEDVYHASLLAHAGCTAGASLFDALIHGDDLAAHREVFLRDPANPMDIFKWMLRHVAAGEPFHVRVQRLMEIARGRDDLEEQVRGVCEVAPRLAERLGMSPQVSKALRYRLERWDGNGPQRLRGEDTPLTSQIAHVCMVLVGFYGSEGRSAAEEAARRKRGSVFAPEVVDAFLAASADETFWAELAKPDLWETVLDLEPGSPRMIATEDQIEDVALAFADFADMKTAHKAGHSRSTAALAVAVAEKMDLPQSLVVTVRHAALVHDVGDVAVQGRILAKEAPLAQWEIEQVCLHPHYTERILSRVPALIPVATIAGAHHEWMNGEGYHRGLAGSQIPLGARILALVDGFQELVEGRPGYGGLEKEEALRRMSAEVGTRFDHECFEALSGVVGVGVVIESSRRQWPAGLTDREVEVLRVSATGLTKRQMARRLTISEKTVGTHLEHIYSKVGCFSRAAAVLYAMEHGLLR